jgi:hypothetical protein
MFAPHNVNGTYLEQVDYPVTVQCPLPEMPRARPLCLGCYKAIEHRKGGVHQWIMDGRPKLKAYNKNLLKSGMHVWEQLV